VTPSSGDALTKPGDPFFKSVEDELGDKGFLLTSAEDLIKWARTGSLMWMTFGLACATRYAASAVTP